MAMVVGDITVNLDFRLSLWQAIKMRIAGKGLSKRLVDEFIMVRLKELRGAGDSQPRNEESKDYCDWTKVNSNAIGGYFKSCSIEATTNKPGSFCHNCGKPVRISE